MKRLPRVASMLFVLAATAAAALVLAQVGKVKLEAPKPIEPEANLYWTHPYGHTAEAPCPHRKHPGGDPVFGPCTCLPVPQHPNGHAIIAPCPHKKRQHPNGHDTGKKDPFGNAIMAPCTHLETEHPGGHPGLTSPCTHPGPKPHPNGHALPNKPCNHPAHPAGHGVATPCNHPLAMDLTPNNLGLKFFTTDPSIQSAVKAASSKLQNAGINIGIPRKLSVFYREPINGDPNDNSDPFWSHYNPGWHSIQLTKGRPIEDLRDTALHELGHALLGHKFVHIKSPNGEHSINDAKDAGLAMSEGWAHFVGLYLSGAPKTYKGFNWEEIKAHPDIPFSVKNEFRVACILWDLYDSGVDLNARSAPAFTPPKFTFADLFKVFSPTLATLANGPVIPSVDDFVKRLKNNVPNKAHLIDPVVKYNLTPP